MNRSTGQRLFTLRVPTVPCSGLLDWEWTKAGGDNANDEESCGPSIWYFLQSKGSEELEFLSTVIAAKTMNVVFFLRKLVLSINICR